MNPILKSLCSAFIACGFILTIISTDCSAGTVIFREQVLPVLGGKIPDSTFQPERLYTNRLNKNGIYTLDGVYFQERHPDRHHFPRAFLPNTIKLQLPPNNKHVAKPGRSFEPLIIDTTYIIRKTVADIIKPNKIDFKDLPLTPVHSLELSYRDIKENPYDHESNEILRRYLPILEKMHDIFER